MMMMLKRAANDQIYDALIKHQVHVMWTARYIERKMIAEVDATNAALKRLLRRKSRLARMGKLTKTYQKELAQLSEQVARLRAKGFLAARKAADADFVQLARQEVEFIDDAIQRAIPFDIFTSTVPTKTVRNIVAFGNFSGDGLKQWYKKWEAADLYRINNTIRADLAQGLTLGKIEQHLFGTRAAKYTDGILQGTRNDASRLARTCTNGVTNATRDEYYRKNADILTGKLYSAVFDGRTSMICAERGGTVYPLDNAPELPAHPNCRSVYIPVVDGIGVIGNAPTVGGTNFREEAKKQYLGEQAAKGIDDKTARGRWNNLSSSYKNKLMNDRRKLFADKVIGSTPADTTYESWLKRQSTGLQNSVLGKTRGELFRNGKLSLSQMMNDNRVLSVEQLRAMSKI